MDVIIVTFRESINLFKIDDLKELKNVDKEKEDIEEADVQARKDGLLNYVENLWNYSVICYHQNLSHLS